MIQETLAEFAGSVEELEHILKKYV
jgi:hypothetical protein